MMMMMMTLMKLVNSATKFRHGIDKFYQPNSGLRSSRTWDEAIYGAALATPPPPPHQWVWVDSIVWFFWSPPLWPVVVVWFFWSPPPVACGGGMVLLVPPPPVACGGGMLVCWYVGMLVCMYVCMCVCVYVCVCVCVCLRVCVYVCMCMYVCMECKVR